jgi:hypothetical protein
MKWHKLNNILHRDIGYFLIGMTLIYAISGIAINHRDDWNPNYIVKNEVYIISMDLLKDNADKETAKEILEKAGENGNYKFHFYPNPNLLQIFIDGGIMRVDTRTGEASLELIRKRPVFKELNFLHYNPGRAWMWFSDAFAVGLIILSITGIFVLKGKKGWKGRGKWFISAGLIIPFLFLWYYLT